MPLTMNVRKNPSVNASFHSEGAYCLFVSLSLKQEFQTPIVKKTHCPWRRLESFPFTKLFSISRKIIILKQYKLKYDPREWNHQAIMPCAKTNKNTLKKKSVSFLFSGRKSWFSRRNLPNGLRGLKWQRKRSLIEIIILGPKSNSL